jgi:hypothetical protein
MMVEKRLTIRTSSKSKLFLYLLVIVALALMMMVMRGISQTSHTFNLESPPQGWHRYVSNQNKAIWLPTDWVGILEEYGDIGPVTKYQREGDTITEITNIFVHFNQVEDASEYFQRTFSKALLFSIYEITIGEMSIPCARYRVRDTVANVRHECIFGPYQAPNESEGIDEAYSFAVVFILFTDEQKEGEIFVDWENMMRSYWLEQMPLSND